jgi:hypothetical protein
MQRLYHHQTVVYARTVHKCYFVCATPDQLGHRAISDRRIDNCTSVCVATVETLHATSLPPPNRHIRTDGAFIVFACAPHRSPCGIVPFPPSVRYLYVGWYRDRRDVACNVSTITKPLYAHGRCINVIPCASHRTHCGIVPFPTVSSIFICWLVSHP